MANLYDMLFGGGTGAVAQPYANPGPSSPPPKTYADIVGRFADPRGLEGTGPLEWRGQTANTVPVMTMPSMSGGARSTPTEWPVQASRFNQFPHNYYPGMGIAREAPDFGAANRLTADMTGGGRPPKTAVAAIEQAVPRWPALSGNPRYGYTGRPHMAVTKLPPSPIHTLAPPQDAQAQQIADELRMPVRKSSGAVVQPKGGGKQTVAGRITPKSGGSGVIPRIFDAATGGAKPTVLQDIMKGLGTMQMPKMGGGPTPGSPAAKWLDDGGGYYKSPGTGTTGSLV